MTEQAGSAARDPRYTPDAGDLLTAADYLKSRAQKIAAVIKVLDEAEQTPDLLDIHQDVDGGARVTLAEYFFITARECRNMVRSIKGVLRKAGWTDTSELLLNEAFEALVDAWATYQKLLGHLDLARWGGQPSHGQVLMDLEKPRRNYIRALDAYLIQLLVTQGILEQVLNLNISQLKTRALLFRQE